VSLADIHFGPENYRWLDGLLRQQYAKGALSSAERGDFLAVTYSRISITTTDQPTDPSGVHDDSGRMAFFVEFTVVFGLVGKARVSEGMEETRKLAAILAADVVGYSRLTSADEDRTLARLRTLRSDLIDPTSR
jgi:hypothetical protein